jgi:16S rRNA (cytosine967-C5)-methyltransferase
MDVDATRLQKVSQNLQRLGLQASLLAGDASQPGDLLAPASFDRILVDAPCSATGVIRRHPDVKLLRREQDIDQLARLQQGILRGLWPALKPGGVLLYATCSVLAQENSEVIEQFLARQPGSAAIPLETSWGEAAGRGRQLLPSPDGADGLFYAMLRKPD